MMSGKQATIYTPYIICGREMYDDLSQLTDNNVSVEIITNDVAKGANPWGCTDYLNEKKDMENRCESLRIYGSPFLPYESRSHR